MTDRMPQIIASLEPEIRKAFLSAINDLRGSVQIKEVVDALESGRIEQALEALNLDASFFHPLEDAIRAAFMGAGAQALASVTFPRGMKVVARFNGSNPRAAEWVRKRGADLVTEIVTDQRDGIRAFVSESYTSGVHPRSIALDLVGRVNPATGRRAGGIIGLRSDQIEAVRRMRQELGGVPDYAAYARRQARDRSFDKLVARAAREGKPLDKATIDRITGRYADKLLLVRGETIARTEALAGAHRAQVEGMQQLIDAGKVDAQSVKKVWSATDKVKTKYSRTRDSHIRLNGTEIPWNEAFRSPTTGRLMMHPGDTSLGAHGEDTINCRCHMLIRIDRYAALRQRELAG